MQASAPKQCSALNFGRDLTLSRCNNASPGSEAAPNAELWEVPYIEQVQDVLQVQEEVREELGELFELLN